jgi:hypothetical protein
MDMSKTVHIGHSRIGAQGSEALAVGTGPAADILAPRPKPSELPGLAAKSTLDKLSPVHIQLHIMRKVAHGTTARTRTSARTERPCLGG